ncbi:MAG: glycosyltransferase [Planctomycetota bacterium]
MIGGKSVSAFVIAQDEEDNIADCLESIKWVDDLVVVDGFSQDRTVEIAESCEARVIRREFDGFVPQTRFALSQTEGHWVLWLDADERSSPSWRGRARRSTLDLPCPGRRISSAAGSRTGDGIPSASCVLGSDRARA